MEKKKIIDLIIVSILLLIFGTGEFVTVTSVSIKKGFDLTSFLAVAVSPARRQPASGRQALFDVAVIVVRAWRALH